MTSATTEAAVTFAIPIPPASLSPNGRAHWRTKARDTSDVRSDAAMLARHEMWATGLTSHPWDAAVMDIVWRFAGTRPDDDNAWARLKAARDGIADACIVANDQALKIGTATFERVKRVDQCVVITVRQVTT